MYDPGFDIRPITDPMGFSYGDDVFGPDVERRYLDDIRSSLKDPDCSGPEVVYAIAMDVGKTDHRELLEDRMLLYGAVTYAAGQLGDEPVRSQGHVHQVSSHSGWSPPEVYEIWTGQATIYMQERAKDHPGRCYAVHAGPGDVVVVPPAWAHATISADPTTPLTFGAWCDRESNFLYEEIRKRNGLAWYPVLDHEQNLTWQHNDAYEKQELKEKEPASYSFLGLDDNSSIYKQFEEDPDRFQFVSKPSWMEEHWTNFVP